MCLKQQGALKRTWAFIPETKAKSYYLALVLHCRPAQCVSLPTAPSHSLLHALGWGVPLQEQHASLRDCPFAKDLSSSRGFIQKTFRESGLPSTGKLCAVLQHFVALLGILRNHFVLLLAPYARSTVEKPWNCNSRESTASENQDQIPPHR